jgi:hypothetical protein
METLTDDLLKNIFVRLSLRDQSVLKQVNKSYNKLIKISTNDILEYLFCDIIANEGNNYEIISCNSPIIRGLNSSLNH